MDNRPIGVFDSGLGGLTVVRQLLSTLPGEDIVYFGDTGRVPYGTRSPETIEKYTRQDCRFLLSKGVKLIIAACGTVSSVASHILRELPVPAMGVVEPTADAAVSASKTGRIGILGTAATIRSASFERRILEIRPDAVVIPVACPLFVPLVENGWSEPDNEATLAAARRYLAPLADKRVDTLILGCTHFPLLAPVISKIVGPDVALVDSGSACATLCADRLERDGALNRTKRAGMCRFYVSDLPDDFTHVARMFLGREVDGDTERVDMETLLGAGAPDTV